MFFESSWSRKSIGDVDVIYHEGLYHLFHLVLPNHDFIAHAISDNAINWRRVDNALFIGDPGSWDDLMLWTMHVSSDPHQPGRWRMFYTGLSRRDQGKVQRIGLAVSDDLFKWRKASVDWEDLRGHDDPQIVKNAREQSALQASDRIKAKSDPQSCFPLEASEEFYEASLDSPRNWVSFRDPFYYRDNDKGWLLTAGRTKSGPILRRGCVALMEEVSPDHFQPMPPLHAPMQYDDIEVPNLFQIDGDYYLIGSLREDAKIRYWHTSEIGKPWKNYYDNVLLAKGNYAGRICQDDEGLLLWNFYTDNISDRTSNNLMPPPKRIRRLENGQLQITTFEKLYERKTGQLDTRCVSSLKGGHEESFCKLDDTALELVSEAGFQGFIFEDKASCFRLNCKVSMTGIGKCGILCRIDQDTHDGYYLSLDLLKGIAQFRAWKTQCDQVGEHMLKFETLQEGYWKRSNLDSISLQLISFGSYHEFSVDGAVVLSLVDATFQTGHLGFYVETAELSIDKLVVETIEPPTQSDDHLTTG